MCIDEIKKEIMDLVDQGEMDEDILADLEDCNSEAEIDLVLEIYS